MSGRIIVPAGVVRTPDEIARRPASGRASAGPLLAPPLPEPSRAWQAVGLGIVVACVAGVVALVVRLA